MKLEKLTKESMFKLEEQIEKQTFSLNKQLKESDDSLKGFNEVDKFFKQAKQLGLKTLRDLKDFLDNPEVKYKKSGEERLTARDKMQGYSDLINSDDTLEEGKALTDFKRARTKYRNYRNSLSDNELDLQSKDANSKLGKLANIVDDKIKPMQDETEQELVKKQEENESLDEAKYQTTSASGNKMTFEIIGNKLIIKDGEETKELELANPEAAKKTIAGTEDIKTIEEDLEDTRTVIDTENNEIKTYTLDNVEKVEEPTTQETKSGLIAVVNALINDENEAIDGYNSAIVNFEVEGKGELTDVLRSILEEEQVHIGELQKILEQLDSSFIDNVEAGQEEAEETLSGESIQEDLNSNIDVEQAEKLYDQYSDAMKILQEG